MTDRELLEAAAKAAGIELRFSANGAPLSRDVINPEAWHGWNPLTDDGDALLLAVRLGIHISPDCEHESAKRESRAATPSAAHLMRELHGEDPYAATRRAIVRAAAAMAPKEG